MPHPKDEKFRTCQGCRQRIPVEDLPWDRVKGKTRGRLKRLLLCDPCWERKQERDQLRDLESWPDYEETLHEGFLMLYQDRQFGPGLDPDDIDYYGCSPEWAFVWPSEKIIEMGKANSSIKAIIYV